MQPGVFKVPTKEKKSELEKTVQEAALEARRTLKELSAVRQAMLKTKQRVLTGKELEVRIWEVWSFVRENKGSLDSEKACKQIREIMEAAVADVASRIEQAYAATTKLQEENSELRKQLKEAKKQTSNTIVSGVVLANPEELVQQ